MIAFWIAVALSGVGLVQLLAAVALVARFARAKSRSAYQTRPCPLTLPADTPPPVSVLKPLHGDEPLLEEALASVFKQDYAAIQIVFGVQDAADSALPVVRRLQARFPDHDTAVVVDATDHGLNRKIANLMNMLPAAKHDLLVIADSDVHAAPDWLGRLVAALSAPGVGLVTTIYTGLPFFLARAVGRSTASAPAILPCSTARGDRTLSRRLPALLGALQINQYFLPGALLARALGRQDCLGATMMLRRQTLDRVGGLRALVDHLADDNVLGRLVQRLGLAVALADTVPATTVPEASLGALWRHELRWARTIRALVPGQFAASVLQYPLAWATFGILLADGAPASLLWLGIVWGVRALASYGIDRALALAARSPLWLLPLRELLSLAVMVTSYAGRKVDWRGHKLEAEGFDPRW
jgi:ceramide glucosyltransferase